jgi:hypothetical protein
MAHPIELSNEKFVQEKTINARLSANLVNLGNALPDA